MEKHIIIAGTCRSGKTTLSLELSKEGYTHYKMDSIKRGICSAFNINGNDWLNLSPKISFILNTIITENSTDTVYLKEKYVLDVSYLFPKDAISINRNNTLIIFLGYSKNTVEKQAELIRINDKDYYWSSKLSDNELIEMTKRNIEFSKYLESECIKYNIPYFDTSFDRDKQIKKIKKYILVNMSR